MADAKKTVVIGFVGSTLDQGRKPDRWQRWRPNLIRGESQIDGNVGVLRLAC